MPNGRLLRVRRHVLTRDHVKANPALLFIFGENTRFAGKEGLAPNMRGEPNAVGIPVKWRDGTDDAAFFSEADWNDDEKAIKQGVILTVDRIAKIKHTGRDVVFPEDGFGAGLEELSYRTPSMFAWLMDKLTHLEAEQ